MIDININLLYRFLQLNIVYYLYENDIITDKDVTMVYDKCSNLR